MKNVDPKIAEFGSEVLRVMHEQRVGVMNATFVVVTQRESYALFEAVKRAVIGCIEEHEELRNTIVCQLRTDRSRSTINYTTFVEASAAALAKSEEEKDAEYSNSPIEPPALENGQFLLLMV